ncbi:MAG TPA: cyclic nucleotide-binding domain-containing protein [Agitococcus sp.]|nr:cyclic nucleotide-binding domain-containing protein [Agitococcus sp.]
MDQQYLELLQAMPIFGGVSQQTLSFLLTRCPEIEIAQNAYFFKEGEQADSLFILERGTALVLKGRDIKLRYLVRGDCFGEMSLIDLNPRSASVRAIEPCIALELSRQSLFALYEYDLEQFVIIQMNLSREVSRRLRALDERLMSLDTELLKLINVL